MNTGLDRTEFRRRLQAAKDASDDGERRRCLEDLARADIDFVQATQLARHLDAINTPANAVKIAVLSSCTCDHLAPGIRVAGLRHSVPVVVWSGGYAQYRNETLQPPTDLLEFEPGYVLYSIHAAHLCSGIPLQSSTQAADAEIEDRVAEIAELWRIAGDRLNATVIQQSCLDTTEPLFGSFDRLVEGSPHYLVQELNRHLAREALKQSIGFLDIARQCARDGLHCWFDESRWLQAKMEIVPTAALQYGELLIRQINARAGRSRKCLVLDLDNTLWGGVVGDDGVEGLQLGPGTAIGEAHCNLQRFARQLRERGILLAVCSKNDESAARAPFLKHPEMMLKLDDFAAFVANWEDKAANLRRIAKMLNLGLESLVFLDDNPAERSRVRDALPMVGVPELPADPAGYVRCLADQGYFEAFAYTADDSARASQYEANARREELADTAVSMDDYLRSLQMELTFGPITDVDMDRVTQLFAKTNQFNTTTIRYSRDKIREFAESENCITLQCRLRDRFGDNGLVSVMVLTPEQGGSRVLRIANWVMSCRVFGRQLEQEFMNIAIHQAKNCGVELFVADHIPTEKNSVIESLYADLGFTRGEDRPGQDSKATCWTLELKGYLPGKTFIAHKE